MFNHRKEQREALANVVAVKIQTLLEQQWDDITKSDEYINFSLEGDPQWEFLNDSIASINKILNTETTVSWDNRHKLSNVVRDFIADKIHYFNSTRNKRFKKEFYNKSLWSTKDLVLDIINSEANPNSQKIDTLVKKFLDAHSIS